MNDIKVIFFLLIGLFAITIISDIRKERKKKRLERQRQQAYQEYVNRISAGNYQTPYEYEQFVGLWLKRKGYQNVQVTQQSGDYGADIICTDSDGNYVAVQCKLYKKPVGYRAVEEVLGALHYYNCSRAMVVTNNSYTKQAIEAANRTGVELWEGVYQLPQLHEPEQKKKGRRKK